MKKAFIAIFVLSLFLISALGRREVNPYDGVQDADDGDDIYAQRAQRSAAKRAAQNRRPAFGGSSDDDESDDAPRGVRSFKDDDDDEMDDTDPATRSRLKALERSFKKAFGESTENAGKDSNIDMDKIRELLSQDKKERAGHNSKENAHKTEEVFVTQPNEENLREESESLSKTEETETANLKSSEEKISLVDL